MKFFKKDLKEAFKKVEEGPLEGADPIMVEAEARRARMAAKSKIESDRANEAILYALTLVERGVSAALIVPDMNGVYYCKRLFSKTKEVQELSVVKHRDDGVDFSNNTTIRFLRGISKYDASYILGQDPEGKPREFEILDVQEFEGDPDMAILADVFGWD